MSALPDTPPAWPACHHAFERQAALTPQACAVVFESSASGYAELTYAELNRRANALAQQLRARGARRGRFVGIHLERSPDMVVAVLAALKSGAAYLPLDPGYPTARLRHMLDDAAPAVLITTRELAAALPVHTAATLLVGEAPAATTHGQDHDVGVTGADVAYLMYTSGSTGRPKGVLVTHRGVANYLAWRYDYFALQPGERVLQKASLSFDDSVWEILEPLSCGAAVVLARPRFEFDSAYLVQLMVQQRIGAACFVPSLLRAIIEEPAISGCTRLRRLTTGGEVLAPELQRRVLERLPGVALYNGYGATETTIASTFWHCTDSPGQASVPIGRPIAHTQVYVLDPQRRPAPQGCEGEICIGGAGVALGYLNLPALTAERFIPDPFSGNAGRLYRTGDLGRWRADGVLEFIGRADQQVKLRGVRIELGEIETALAEHPGVSAAAALCTDAGESSQLVACIVARGAPPPAAELRDYLRARLPGAMIPSRIVRLDALPLMPSGKLDRSALALLAGASDTHTGYTPAEDALEQQLVELWKQVLEARPIGRSDDFFALGGHSLSAVRLAAAIERTFDRRLPPALLFESPTIAELARRLREPSAAAALPSLVPLAAGTAASTRALFLVHQIEGDVFSYRELARQLDGQVPVYGLQAQGLEDSTTPLASIEAMAARYLEEIRALQPHGPYAIGGHSSGGLIALEIAQQLYAAGERVEPLAIIDINADTWRGRSLPDGLRRKIETLRNLPADQRVGYLSRRLSAWIDTTLQRVRGTGVALIADNGSGYGPVRQGMEDAVRNYRPLPYPGVVTLFRALDRSVTGTYARTLGWRRIARGGIRVINVPGDHQSMLRADAVCTLAARLREALRD